MARYVRSTFAHKFRSPDLSKITETLGCFGDDYRQSFSANIIDTKYHAAWDNIIRARHAIVHKSGVLNITFDELVSSYPKTKTVISALNSALGLI